MPTEDGKRYFIGYGFLEWLDYDEYVNDLLWWTLEDYAEDCIIVSSMGEFRYTNERGIR